ncbi:AroM family protein [Luxibacter massiliensis]|uniref:AroM family protein n=1 Tax=Luxibacter massiliensis TaxID=2219695 RepID=UPI000F06A025|nr:AroM family protein [Luxibacter massiliensis]
MKKIGAVTIGQSPRVGVIPGIMPILGEDIVITPDEQQVQQAYEQWEPIMKEVTPILANPYGDMSEGEGAAQKSKDMAADLIVMDCIGFTKKAKNLVDSITGKPVLLCRTCPARIVSELLGVQLH